MRNFFFIVTPITLTSFTGVNSDVVTGVIYRVALHISIPIEENGERKPSPGRQAVDKFDDAPEATTEVPSACPDCGSSDYEVSEIRSQQLRALQVEFNNAVDHILVHERHGRCFTCGKVHLILPKNTDVLVAPARTIGQRMAIAVGVLSAKGMPVHKSDNIFIIAPDGQLGHSTLNDNVHDWGMQTGKVLADAIADVLRGKRPYHG